EIPKKLQNADLLYSPGFAPSMRSPIPTVVTVHDLIGMAFPSNQKGFSRLYWSWWLPMAVKKAKKIVASSEHTRQDIEKFLKIPAKNIEVVPLGINQFFKKIDRLDKESILKKYGIGSPF